MTMSFQIAGGALILAASKHGKESRFPAVDGQWQVLQRDGALIFAHETQNIDEIPWPSLSLKQQAEESEADIVCGENMYILSTTLERYYGESQLKELSIRTAEQEAFCVNLSPPLAADKWISTGMKDQGGLVALRLDPFFYR
eukprot:Gregarina_sp_Poly_1__4200@NODE_2298_length_2337_cov_30_299559_g1472_i0_p3_GENE_NODE_2298_length_2337_cov_30_299559_g1472_i0NODE_2298_length_2337_cov_30_299559_g1472_i0_p3_ORF_typecomplete_len142_score25_59_NODE_2298_length_2337_cov_30_299559_g1472_i030455